MLIRDWVFPTFKELYDACIPELSDYGAGTWCLGLYPKHDAVPNRSLMSYLGIHENCPTTAPQGEMLFTPQSVRRKAEMTRLWNHLVPMDAEILPRKIFAVEHIVMTLGASHGHEVLESPQRFWECTRKGKKILNIS